MATEFRSCVKVEVNVLGLIVPTVSADVKQHLKKKKGRDQSSGSV